MSLLLLSLSTTALAEGEPCFNDDDCPGGGAACGGDVCNWNKMSATPDGDKIFYCNPAGTQPKGQDGWCTEASDCKCQAQGATCGGTFCTFTKASDAPTPPAGGGGAGGSGVSGGGGAGGAPVAGTTSGGSPVAGAAGTAGSPTTPAPAPAESGGCSVSAPASTGSGALLALGVAGLGLALGRRRR